MNQWMTERIQWIDKQTCWYLMQLLNLDMDFEIHINRLAR